MKHTLLLFEALANDKRLQILGWLKNPESHFPPQHSGDLVRDGVCGVNIAAKLDIAAPTVSRHMRLLVDAGLVTATPIKQWTFYRRDEAAIKAARKKLGAAF